MRIFVGFKCCTNLVCSRNGSTGCSRPEQNGVCQINDKKLKHGCSKLEGNGRICWKKHKESEH